MSLSRDWFSIPLTCISSLRTSETEDFVIYSLRTHSILRTIRLPSATQLNASREFIVLVCILPTPSEPTSDSSSQGTTEPAALHILSARTLESLYIVPSSALITFAHPLTQTASESNNIVSLPHIEHDDDVPHALHVTSIPQPVFTLSNRLLAYVSPAPRVSSPSELPSRLPRTATPTSPVDSQLKFPTSQADLGTAAVKLGGSVLSGMRVLGGMAYSAARAGVSAAAVAAERRYSAEVNPPSITPGRFVSRSAPAASEQPHPQQGPTTSPKMPLEPSLVDREVSADRNNYITVVDLHSLYSQSQPPPCPARIAEFTVGQDQPISLLQFSDDGNSIIVARRDGQTMKVYQLRSLPAGIRSCGWTDESGNRVTVDSSKPVHPPWHVYDLRRGRTSAVVESLSLAHDGRWMAVATQKGTVHIFASNPFGGPTHEASHLHHKVVNPQDVVCCISIIRLRLADARCSSPFPPSWSQSFAFVVRSRL